VVGYRGAYRGHTAEGPKRRFVSGKTKTEARAAPREAKAGRDGSLAFDAHTLTLGKHLDRWLSDSVGDTVRPGSFVRYEQITRLHVTPALGGLRLKNVTLARIRGLYREKLDAGLSGRTVQYVHATLHKALKQAAADGLCRATRRRPSRRRGPEGGDMSPHRRTGACPAGRGARRPLRSPVRPRRALRAQAGELLGLKWEDVDLPSGVLRVRRTLSVAKDGPIFNPPKTAKGRGTVALTDGAASALEARLRRRPSEAEVLGDGYEDRGLVFPGEKGQPCKRTR